MAPYHVYMLCLNLILMHCALCGRFWCSCTVIRRTTESCKSTIASHASSEMLAAFVACALFVCAAASTNTKAFNHTRCRSTADFQKIPWLNSKSTFHHLGHPLVQALCENSNKHTDKLLDCSTVSATIWPQSSDEASRAGPQSSTIIVDPPLRDDGGESSGVFVMNAIYAIFYEMGYNPAIRYWSENLNTHFPEAAANHATNVSNLWDAYSAGKGENPFNDVPNYISFQSEVGIAFYHAKAPRPINNSPFGRTFKWIIGYHNRNKFLHYEHNALEMHCLGANHQLGEGLFCSSSSVIACPMFAFHHKKSQRVTPSTRSSLKQNVVLIDSDAIKDINDRRLERDLKAMGLHDVRVLVHRDRKRHDVPELYAMTKVSLDCRNPGVEFINYEATLYDVLTLACNGRATSNAFDFPIPSKYRLEPSNWPRLVQQVYDLLVNYEHRLPDFKTFKDLSRNSHSMIANQLDVNFFSRDVLFRTYCTTYSECRRTISWAVAIWILYPMARIEVYTEIPHEQYQHDNDVALEMLSRTFNNKFWKIIAWSASSNIQHPALQAPQSPCTHVVYMDPSFLPFGRDFLTTHMRALAATKDPQPITYWSGDRLVLYVKALLDIPVSNVLRVVRASTKAVEWYLATGSVARAIDSMEALKAMEGSGIARLNVNDEYLAGYTIGANMMLDEFLSTPEAKGASALHPPLPGSVSSVPAELSAALVLDAFLIPEVPSQVAISEPMHTVRTSRPGATAPEVMLTEAQLWLSPSVHVPLHTVLNVFSQAQLESIVEHVDPILQSALMQKILGFIPADISKVLKMFDAAEYPNVVSLIDAKANAWGDQC